MVLNLCVVCVCYKSTAFIQLYGHTDYTKIRRSEMMKIHVCRSNWEISTNSFIQKLECYLLILGFYCFHSPRVNTSCMCAYRVHMWQHPIQYNCTIEIIIIVQWYSIWIVIQAPQPTTVNCVHLLRRLKFNTNILISTTIHTSCSRHWHIQIAPRVCTLVLSSSHWWNNHVVAGSWGTLFTPILVKLITRSSPQQPINIQGGYGSTIISQLWL